MSSAEDTRNTQDLLFAALDQSGLTSFDCFSLPPGSADNSASSYAANLTSQGTSIVANATNSESDSNVATLYPTTAEETSSNASVLQKGLNATSPTNCATTASNTAAAASSVTTPGKKNSYARITVGGRKFLIPLEKKNGALPRLVIPSFKASEASPLGRSKLTTGVGKAESNGKSSSILTTTKRAIEVKPSLRHNLGSQFVESAGGLEDTTKRMKEDLKDRIPVPTETRQPKLISKNGLPNVGSSVASRLNSHTGTQMSTDARRKDNIVKAAMAGSYDELPEEEEQENEEVADTYEEYKPSKLTIGLPHPDAVVETSSLSSIPPPDVHYKLSLPEEPIDMGLLSALQLETITYACQKHLLFLPSGERGGFLIGDGAGVGKGRTIAGIIFENYLLGRKRALWFSVSNDLKYDCERDLRDIGAKNIQVHTLNKFKYGKISSRENSSVKKGVVFATYASLISESHTDSKYGTRLKQLLHWCGKEFDGVIIFDECHKAKNLVPAGSTKPTKTGFAVMELQRRLPNARIIYASATGASEPRNMAYMTRIGLWGKGTPFSDFGDFIQAVERRGVGAMELVAMDLKSRGAYIARQLSFHGVSFRIDEVKLPLDFAKMYNEAVRLWVAAREAFQVAADTFGAEYHMKKTMWGQFWAAHQRFFKYLCIAAKVNRTALLAREAVKHGKCVVIGLQSTGEARTLDQLDKCGGELYDFVSTARGVFENLVENHFPAPNRKRITDMFGKDFYKTEDPLKKSVQKRMEKKPSDYEKNCARREQVNTFDESDSDDSVDYSDEDIEKIFGGESDSDDWGVDSDPKPKAKIQKDENAESGSNQTLEDEDVKPNIFTSKSMNGEIGMIKHEKTVLRTLSLTGCDPIMKVQAIKEELLEKLESVNLPNNALDDLIDALGGPENVAEMTGRKGRVVLSDEGLIQYQSRAEKDVGCNLLNLTEKQRFMDGEKNIAIISEAASSGISLQSDRRVRNQRRRLHITLELPWSADRAIQQFGRTHRSNQVNAPEYVFLITELAGERRFASVVAKRLESLGALTHGDRRATETRDLSQYNFDNKYGRLALDSVMKSLIGLSQPLVPPPVKYPGDFYADIREAMLGVGLISSEAQSTNLQLEKESCSIVKFLNRILGIEVLQQNSVFEYFSQTLSFIVRRAKMEGQLDQGIKDIGSSRNLVHHVNCTRFELNNKIGCSGDGPGTNASYVELHTVKVERGLSWENAKTLLAEVHKDSNNGFYLSQLMRNRSHVAILCINNTWGRNYSYGEDRKDKDKLFTIYRPNTGKQAKKETLGFILSKFQKATLDDTRGWWMKQYTTSLLSCSHVYFQGSCRTQNIPCIVGKRQLTYHILSGSVLAVWKMIEHVLATASPAFHKIQIVRFLTKDRGRLVGLLIPEHCLSLLTNFLRNSIPTFSHSSKAVTGKNWNSSYQVNHYASVFDEPDDEFSPDNFVSSVLFAANNPSS